MSTGTHRKTQAAEPVRFGIPWGHALVVVALILALAGGLLLAASLTNPVHASVGALKPAIAAAKTIRPYWDGRSPAVWTADTEPMCMRALSGRVGRAMDPRTGTRFLLQCQAEGDNGPWSWSVV
jgi:hypothetical protein